MGRSILPRRSELDPVQVRACELPFQKPCLVWGPAGTGKTVVVQYRAHYAASRLSQRGAAPIGVFTFTKVLAAWLRYGLRELDASGVEVHSASLWGISLYRERLRCSLPSGDGGVDFDRMWKELAASLRRDGSARRFSVVLVDEAQDIPPEAIERLRRVSGHITVAGDPAQALYRMSRLEEMQRALGPEAQTLQLGTCYRSSVKTLNAAASLLAPARRDALLRSTKRAPRGPDQAMSLATFADADAHWDWVAERLQDCRARRESVAVLTPTRTGRLGLEKQARLLGEREVPCEVVQQDSTNPDFGGDRVSVMTAWQAKGLEFDRVMVPMVTRRWCAHVEERANELLYVALTRSRNQSLLGTLESSAHPLVGKLRQAPADALDQIEPNAAGSAVSLAVEDELDDDLPF